MKKLFKMWVFLLCLLLCALSVSSTASATDRYWVGGSSYWDYFTSSYWNTAQDGSGTSGVPLDDDNVYLFNTSATDKTVSYYQPYSRLFNQVRIDASGDGDMTLNFNYGHTLQAVSEYIGFNDDGIVIQNNSSSVNTMTNMLYLGFNAGAKGYYTLDNGSLSAFTEYIGYNGRGEFTQNGGTNNVTNLYLNNDDYNNWGTYTLNSGTLNVVSIRSNGSSGSQNRFYYKGGTLGMLTGYSSLTIYTNYFSFGSDSGTLDRTFDNTFYFNTDSLNVGFQGGSSVFRQAGANITLNNSLYIGNNLSSGTQANYYLSSGFLGSDNAALSLGNASYGGNANAVFTHSSGTANFGSNTSVIAKSFRNYLGTDVTAKYYLEGADAELTTDTLQISNFYSGTAAGSGAPVHVDGRFYHTAGSHTIKTDLQLGYYYLNYGHYNRTGDLPSLYAYYGLSGGTLHTAGDVSIGLTAYINSAYTSVPELTALFAQSGGTHTIDQGLYVGKTGFDAQYILSNTGTLKAATETIQEDGVFQQNGGSNTATTSLTVESSGTYRIAGGTLTTASIILNDGEFAQTGGILDANYFTQNGGVVTGSLQNQGVFRYYDGTFNARLHNQGTANFYNDFTAVNGILNDDYMYVGNKRNIYVNGAGLLNNGLVDLAGGNIKGSGAVDNFGIFTINDGTIAGSGVMNNYGTFSQGAGAMTIASTGTNNNYGTFNLNTGYQLRLTGSDLDNSGLINLNNAIVSGGSTLENSTGGTITGPGTITTGFSNAGRLIVEPGNTNIINAFTNTGLILLTENTSSLKGGGIANQGSIQGKGFVSNDVDNTNTLEAIGGTLAFSGSLTNQTTGTIAAGPSSKLLVQNGLASNLGLISLTGGTFDNNGHVMTNSGQISGHGIIRTSGLTNSGDMTLTGGNVTVNGDVTNQAGHTVKVAYSPAIFTGDFINWGTFKVTDTHVTFAGSYTENGAFISDPATTSIYDMVINEAGYLVGSEINGEFDKWLIQHSVINHSTQNTAWDTIDAMIGFNGGGSHQYAMAGTDMGAVLSGYENNFAWGYFDLASGASLSLLDGNDIFGGAIYVEALTGVVINNNEVSNISGDFNIYYMAGLDDTNYLQGLTWDFASGTGKLIPVSQTPVPGSLWLLLSGIIGVAVTRRRNFGKIY